MIKPCTAAEIAFYESIHAHPDFAALLPTFMGTLVVSSPEQVQALREQDPMSINAALQAQENAVEKVTLESTAVTPTPDDQSGIYGHRIATRQAIVLENLVVGFTKPNILDVKLGARLWGDDAPPAKRARMAKTASETTSVSLGFRIAGTKVWQPRNSAGREGELANTGEGEYKVYDKIYGRRLTKENVMEGFEEYFLDKSASGQLLTSPRRLVIRRCIEELDTMQRVLQGQESRMYSASILFVYEGDKEVLEAATTGASVEDAAKNAHSLRGMGQRDNAAEEGLDGDQKDGDVDEDEDEEEDEEENKSSICAVKLIDFAHAAWTPGQGVDENALHGIRNVKAILEKMLEPADAPDKGPWRNGEPAVSFREKTKDVRLP